SDVYYLLVASGSVIERRGARGAIKPPMAALCILLNFLCGCKGYFIFAITLLSFVCLSCLSDETILLQSASAGKEQWRHNISICQTWRLGFPDYPIACFILNVHAQRNPGARPAQYRRNPGTTSARSHRAA